MAAAASSLKAYAASASPSPKLAARRTPLVESFWQRVAQAQQRGETPPSLVVAYAGAQRAFVLRVEETDSDDDANADDTADAASVVVLYDYTQRVPAALADAGKAPASRHGLPLLLADDTDGDDTVDEDDDGGGGGTRGDFYYAAEFAPAGAQAVRDALACALDAARADGYGAFVEAIVTKWVYRNDTRTYHERIAERYVDVARNGADATRSDDKSDVPLLGRAALGVAVLMWVRWAHAADAAARIAAL